jgi:hypothetical protein
MTVPPNRVKDTAELFYLPNKRKVHHALRTSRTCYAGLTKPIDRYRCVFWLGIFSRSMYRCPPSGNLHLLACTTWLAVCWTEPHQLTDWAWDCRQETMTQLRMHVQHWHFITNTRRYGVLICHYWAACISGLANLLQIAAQGQHVLQRTIDKLYADGPVYQFRVPEDGCRRHAE